MDNFVGDGEANKNNNAEENKDNKGGQIHPLVREHVRTTSPYQVYRQTIDMWRKAEQRTRTRGD